MFLEIAGEEPFVVHNNFENDNFGLTENLSITFSKAMQTVSFEIALSGPRGTVQVESQWEDDITLTLSPYVSALRANANYFLSLTGYSLDNNYFSESFTFGTITGIQFVQTNLEYVDGEFNNFAIGDDIELTFSMGIDLDNIASSTILVDASSAYVSTVVSLSEDSKTLIIDPLYDLEPGQNYTLMYIVYSDIEGDFTEGNFSFTAEEETVIIPEKIVDFVLNMDADWKADRNTTDISFMWATEVNATGYRIYAHDNHANTDFIRIANFDARDFITFQSGSIDLSSFPQFDFYDEDANQTPFSGRTQLTFMIVGYNAAGEGELSEAIVVRDETAPLGFMTQLGSANNLGNPEATTFRIKFSSNEYLEAIVPNFDIIEAGGDPNLVLPNAAVSFEWDADMKGGYFTIEVPAETNGSGDEYYIQGFKDSSGNMVEEGLSTFLF